MEIEILDVLDCKVSKALADIIRPCLSYPAVFYQQGPHRNIRKEYPKSVMIRGGTGYYFQTGLLDRVLSYCKERRIPIEIKGKIEQVKTTAKPHLKGISFREEQIRAVKNGIGKQRGVLIAPTGTGKTLLGLAIVSAFPNKSVLWLCHTKDLMYQAAEFARIHLSNPCIGYIGDGVCDPNTLTFATRQSFVKQAEELGCDYDIIIIDEVHHLRQNESQYHTIFRNVPAPIRIGLTATMPTDKRAILAIEGSLGPIIECITIEEGQERGIMADVKIKFLKVPMNYQLQEMRRYADVYDRGVVNNFDMHRIVVNAAKKHVEKGDSVLILVVQIQHGENLLTECERQGVEARFAQGATEGAVRTQIRNALNSKNIHCVIATTIFSEGVNIPELNVLINAAGGKSEIRTIQAIGRGLRLTETKKELIFYDVFNPGNNHLVRHFGERICIYSEMGWI